MSRNPAANARVVSTVDYGADPHGYALLDQVRGEALGRLQGHGGVAYVDANGDPGQSFTGYATAQPHYTEAVNARIANFNTFKDSQARTIESSLPDSFSGTDASRRIFADRLRRRSAL